jgi:hypothetical protein
MTLTRKDAAATLFTLLVVLTYAVTQQGWNVPLVGDSVRWAAGVILVLGALTCMQGERTGMTPFAWIAALLGTVALGLGIVAIATGSPTVLGLLVAVDVVLWMLATGRHALQHGPPPVVA